MRQGYFDKFIALLMVLILSFAIFLQMSTVKSTEKLKNTEIEKTEQYAEKIAKLIHARAEGKITQRLSNDPSLREELNEVLHAFLTKQYQYIYLLKKVDTKKYRFLLDASSEEEYNTLFFPKSDQFDKVYHTGKLQIVKQQEEGIEEVWVSLLYPIVVDKKTEALLVLELSKTYGEQLSSFNTPLMKVVWIMEILLLGTFLALVYLGYRYYHVKKAFRHDKLTSAYTKQYLTEFCDMNRIGNFYGMLIDIDEFKQINIKYGEEFGDEAIKMFVQTINKHISTASRVVRVAGTEFLVMIPKHEGNLEVLCEDLFKVLREKKYLINNDVVHLYVSMSAMDIPDNAISIHNVERFLDEKLLEVKNKGKNGLAIIGATHDDELKYSNIDFIKEALEDERLTCLYQPIYDTQTKEIVRYEALVRLIDDEDSGKLISPYYFMDVIKGTSQYIKLSKLVFKHVFETLDRYSDIELSVNVDLDDLDNRDMLSLINGNLEKYYKIANRLTFEILEEHQVKDYDKVNYLFKQLKKYGSKIAIDDFGSGYANYSYLIRLDLDTLKIDGTLIRELQKNPHETKIVLSSIQQLAKKFDYDVVAEFVSDEDIYLMIKELGIEFSQGYFLGEPKPLEAYINA